MGNGCRCLPGALAAQTEEGRGSHVSPAPDSQKPLQASGPPSSPECGLGCPRGAIFSGLSSSHCGASSGQAGRSPTGICMNHNCLWPIMQVRVAARGGQGPDLIGLWVIYCLWLHGLIWAFAQPWGNGFIPLLPQGLGKFHSSFSVSWE